MQNNMFVAFTFEQKISRVMNNSLIYSFFSQTTSVKVVSYSI
jgi:hypothetical protein